MIHPTFEFSTSLALRLDTDGLNRALAALADALTLKLKLIPPDFATLENGHSLPPFYSLFLIAPAPSCRLFVLGSGVLDCPFGGHSRRSAPTTCLFRPPVILL